MPKECKQGKKMEWKVSEKESERVNGTEKIRNENVKD